MNRDENEFVGSFIRERKLMDYTWFGNYTPERQIVQDNIIYSLLNGKTKSNKRKAIFTCGIFGSGKTRTLKWMSSQGMIDLDSFVLINPDEIKHLLPDFKKMLKIDPKNAAKAIHKESTYISLLVEYRAIYAEMNYIVDGSLQNWEWYLTHLSGIQNYQTTIIRVSCDFDIAVKRCDSRAKITGRYIDPSYLKTIDEKVHVAFKNLKKEVDLVIEINNTVSPVLENITIN